MKKIFYLLPLLFLITLVSAQYSYYNPDRPKLTLQNIVNSCSGSLSEVDPFYFSNPSNYCNSSNGYCSGGGGANTELSNLGTTAINSNLLFNAGNTYDIGDAIKGVAQVYTTGVKFHSGEWIYGDGYMGGRIYFQGVNVISGFSQIGIPSSLIDITNTYGYTVAQAESASGITPAPDGIYYSPSSITIQNGLITSIT